MASRYEENKKVLEKIYNLMTADEYKSMTDSEKTEEAVKYLLVDMSVNLAIIADHLIDKDRDK